VSIRLLPLSVLAGAACAVAAVAVHQWWWGAVLAVVAVVAVVLCTPAGWTTRLPFGAAYAAVTALVSTTRGEGDFLVGSTASGYVVLGLGLVVLVLCVATLPRPGRSAGPDPAEAISPGTR